MLQKSALSLVFALALSACASVPLMGTLDASRPHTEVRAVVDQILCEIQAVREQQAAEQRRIAAASASPTVVAPAAIDAYWVAFSLNLKLEDSSGFTPSITDIDPLPGASTSRGATLGGDITRGRTRSFTQNGSFRVNRIPANYCNTPAAGAEAMHALEADPTRHGQRGTSSLSGSLGLSEVILSGLDGVSMMDGLLTAQTPSAKIGAVDTAPTFGSTIQFSLRQSINGGPNVTRVHFRGFGGNTGLFNNSSTETNQLTIAFGRASPQAAQSVVQSLILQNLDLNRN